MYGRGCVLPDTGSDQLARKACQLKPEILISIQKAAGPETAQNYFQIRMTIGKAGRRRE